LRTLGRIARRDRYHIAQHPRAQGRHRFRAGTDVFGVRRIQELHAVVLRCDLGPADGTGDPTLGRARGASDPCAKKYVECGVTARANAMRTILLTNATQYAGPGATEALLQQKMRLVCHDPAFQERAVRDDFMAGHPGTDCLESADPTA